MITAPAARIAIITPHDTNEIDPPTRGFHANTDGNVYVQLVGDDAVSGPHAVIAGADYAWRLKLVHTDTTATIAGLY